MSTPQNMTMLDGQQVLRSAFDDATQALRVENVSSSTIGSVTLKDGVTTDVATVTPANALKVDGSAVTQPVSAASLPLPIGASTLTAQNTGNTSLATIATNTTGASTAAKQDTGNTSLSSIDTKLTSQATAANQTSELTKLDTLHIDLGVIEGKQDTGNTSLGSIDTKLTTTNSSLSSIATNTSGSATSANQTTEISKLTSIDGKITAVDTGAVVVASSALPSGAASETSLSFIVTSSGQAAANTASLNLSQGSTASGQTGPLVMGSVTAAAPTYSSGQVDALSLTTAGRLRIDGTGTTQPVSGSIKVAGKSPTEFKRNDYTGTSVTTAAYVQLIASTVSPATEMFIFDSSGQTLVIAFGAALSEVDQFLVVPGGNGTVPISIPVSTRISIKAVSADATSGEIDLNLFA